MFSTMLIPRFSGRICPNMIRSSPRSGTMRNSSTSETVLGHEKAKEAARKLQKEELLRDLERLQKKELDPTIGKRSWSDAFNDTLKVARPQLINVGATFMMFVMSMQVVASRREMRSAQEDLKNVEDELNGLKLLIGKLRDESFSEKLARIADDRNEMKQEEASSSWFSLRKSTVENERAPVQEVASELRKEIIALVGERKSEDGDSSNAGEVDQTKLLIEDIIASTKSDNEGKEADDLEEVVMVEQDKVVKRKKFIM